MEIHRTYSLAERNSFLTTKGEQSSPEGGVLLETAPYLNGVRCGISYGISPDTGRPYHYAVSLDNTGDNWDYWELHRSGRVSFCMPMRNRMRNGVSTCWNEDGVLILSSTWKNDMLDGPYVKWHPNGQTKSKKLYRNGALEGPWFEWDDTGTLVSSGVHHEASLKNCDGEHPG